MFVRLSFSSNHSIKISVWSKVYGSSEKKGCKTCGTRLELENIPPHTLCCFVVFVFFCHPVYYLHPFFLAPSLVATQIRGHIAGSFPPSPPRFVPCIFIARRFQLFLPSSTRVELRLYIHTNHAGVVGSCQ